MIINLIEKSIIDYILICYYFYICYYLKGFYFIRKYILLASLFYNAIYAYTIFLSSCVKEMYKKKLYFDIKPRILKKDNLSGYIHKNTQYILKFLVSI